MARPLLIFSFLILPFSQVRAQQFLDPSFEAVSQGSGRPGLPWEFYEQQSTPDHQPGNGTFLEAVDGEKYAGMVFRADSTTEYLGQPMIPALQANSYYKFDVWLCYTKSLHRYDNPGSMRVLGINPDEDPYVLWSSPLITKTKWDLYTVYFKTPDVPIQSLYFQCYYGRENDRQGNVLIDHIGLIKKLPIPCIELGNDTTLCLGDTLTLTASTDSSRFRWQDGSKEHHFIVSEPGTYWVDASLGNIIARDSIVVDYGYLPPFDLGPDTTLCYGNELEFGIISKEQPVSFQWNTGHTLPHITIREAGRYDVLVSNGPCQISDSINVSYRDCDMILNMPNIISPNSDGINDAFVPIEIKDVYEPELVIYDRWGRQVYTAFSLDIGWQGESPAGPAPEGVYFWVLDYSDAYGEQHVDKGFLSLMR